jgi:endonuclease/exonuclease/phosphatase family metal-dependent hydrolase
LEQLQDCLAHGTPTDRLKKQKDELLSVKTQLLEEKARQEALKKDLDAKQAEIDAARADLEAQRQQLAQQTAELEQKAALHEGLVQEQDRLTSQQEDFKQQVARFKADKQDLSKQPPTMRFALTKELITQCNTATSCESCIAIQDGYSGCAWCGESGQCFPHHVNAAEDSKEDGLLSGQCPLPQWYSHVTTRLRVLSMNINGGNQNEATLRAASILSLIETSGADIVLLQEVEQWFLRALTEDVKMSSMYQITDFGEQHIPGGLFVMSRNPYTTVSYYEQVHPGELRVAQRARLLLVQVMVDGKPLTVALTDLPTQSDLAASGAIDFIFSTLAPFGDVIIAGDFVTAPSNPVNRRIPSDYVDVWAALQGDAPGYTYDPISNPYATFVDGLSRRNPVREDRVLVRSTSFLPRSISLVGCSNDDLLCQHRPAQPPQNAQVTPGAYLSTHYGLLVEFSKFKPFCPAPGTRPQAPRPKPATTTPTPTPTPILSAPTIIAPSTPTLPPTPILSTPTPVLLASPPIVNNHNNNVHNNNLLNNNIDSKKYGNSKREEEEISLLSVDAHATTDIATPPTKPIMPVAPRQTSDFKMLQEAMKIPEMDEFVQHMPIGEPPSDPFSDSSPPATLSKNHPPSSHPGSIPLRDIHPPEFQAIPVRGRFNGRFGDRAGGY